MEGRLIGLEEKVSKLEERICELENAFINSQGILIATFELKNISTPTEALSLRSIMKTLLPIPKTKHERFMKNLSSRLIRIRRLHYG